MGFEADKFIQQSHHPWFKGWDRQIPDTGLFSRPKKAKRRIIEIYYDF